MVMPGSDPGTARKVNRFSTTASAMTPSIRANWSPTHFLRPKGTTAHCDRGLAGAYSAGTPHVRAQPEATSSECYVCCFFLQ